MQLIYVKKNGLFFWMEIVSIFYLANGLVTLILISATRGWGVNFTTDHGICLQNLSSLLFFKSYTSFLNNFKFGFLKLYSFHLKLKGMGFKILSHTCGLILKLGYSHRVVVLKKTEISISYKSKQWLIVKSRKAYCLQQWLFLIFNLKPRPLYNQKGFYIKGEQKLIKSSSKVK